MARVLIGTSGWHYESWRGPFFPQGLPIKNQLQYYASQFDTTELNGVFYRTPTPETVKNWHEQTGKPFVFAWKASKYITHWKRLSDRSASSLALMEQRIALLGRKVGPILFQLPPQFEVDADRLASFSRLLSRKRRYAFEFRHPSWYQPRILRMLAEENIALCLSTIMTRRRHGSAPPTLSMCAATVRAGAIADTIEPMRSPNGPGALRRGSGRAATSMSISTTIRKAPRRPTH